MPRRARHLIPTQFPRRGEVISACAVLLLLTHLMFAQLTFVLAAVFAGISKASRWRLWWLAVPAAAGLAWTLAIGPRAAAAGFAAGPARILGYFGGGHPLSRLPHPHGAFAGIGSWLPRQLPLALLAGAAEAALAGWLNWVHTDEWAVPPRRPGVFAAARAAAARRAIRGGAVVTRDGCSLGVARASGARVVLSWPEIAGGVLVTGASARVLTVTSLQLVHAALRRRKPLIAVDLTADPAVAGALAAACAATGSPLRVFTAAEGHYEPFRDAGPGRRLAMTLALLGADHRPGDAVRDYLRAVFELIDQVPADRRTPVLDDVLRLLDPRALQARLRLVPGASPRGSRVAGMARTAARTAQATPGAIETTARRLAAVRNSPAGRRLIPAPGGIDLARVVRERSAALFGLHAADPVARLVCADVMAVGEDLLRIGVDGDGLVWLSGYGTEPAGVLAPLVAGLVTGGAAAGLPVLVTTTSPVAAADLADQVNAVLLHRPADAAAAAALAPRTGSRLVPAGARGRQVNGTDVAAAAASAAPAVLTARAATAVPPAAAEFAVQPAVPGAALLSLAPGQFVLTVSSPRYRLVELGQTVPARLPRGAGP